MLKKTIVTTTINAPTEATLKFCEKKDFNFIIVGDLKTPHNLYHELEQKYKHVKYLHPSEQDSKYKELSDAIGWNCIQRRNLGFIYAYDTESDVIASVDDDNIPYDFWGENIFVGKEIVSDYYETENLVFDPLSVTNYPNIWHRGFPIELLQIKNNVEYKGKIKRTILVQANLWDGDPDIDAMTRLTMKPIVKFNTVLPFCSNKISPFNSQNTFLSRSVLKNYMMLPYIGRMDDIWASYILQYFNPDCVAYDKATVYQDRNKQDLIKNLQNEIFGYRHTFDLIQNLNNFKKMLPENTLKAFEIYTNSFY